MMGVSGSIPNSTCYVLRSWQGHRLVTTSIFQRITFKQIHRNREKGTRKDCGFARPKFIRRGSRLL